VARILQAAWLALAALMLPACTAAEDAPEDKAPDYRYRLTVEVETPEGVKTGSSVIEVRQSIGRTTMDGFGEQIYLRIRGEAVAVDLPDGRTLYALLRSGGDVEWAARVIPLLSPDAKDDNSLDDFLLLEGKQELPRRWTAQGPFNNVSAYPMMVTFGDLADPTSVELVDPDDLAATFGESVKLKRITAELTHDPVTTGIDERLGWLPNYYDKMLDGRTIHTIEAENRLANNLSQGDFSKGLLQ
jgi:hypothetical protein